MSLYTVMLIYHYKEFLLHFRALIYRNCIDISKKAFLFVVVILKNKYWPPKARMDMEAKDNRRNQSKALGAV